MTQSPNSPQAQEVKACPFCGRDPVIMRVEVLGRAFYSLKCCFTIDEERRDYLISRWNTRAPNENQPPLAEKSLLNPNPLSCQSDGNREKELEERLKLIGLIFCNIAILKKMRNAKEFTFAHERMIADQENELIKKTNEHISIKPAMNSQDERKCMITFQEWIKDIKLTPYTDAESLAEQAWNEALDVNYSELANLRTKLEVARKAIFKARDELGCGSTFLDLEKASEAIK